MIIRKLTTGLLHDVKPAIFKRSDKLYYNIRHGSIGEGLHSYTIALNAHEFKPKDRSDNIVLDKNNYVIKPIFKDGKLVKDKEDNQLYCISTDDMEDHKKDYIILWEIPNKFYTNVSYSVNGSVNLLGSGRIGRNRGNLSYISPAPVLEVYGTCELKWTAMKDNVSYEQTITFDGEEWHIGTVNKISEV